jgi:hypothetical protein
MVDLPFVPPASLPALLTLSFASAFCPEHGHIAETAPHNFLVARGSYPKFAKSSRHTKLIAPRLCFRH